MLKNKLRSKKSDENNQITEARAMTSADFTHDNLVSGNLQESQYMS